MVKGIVKTVVCCTIGIFICSFWGCERCKVCVGDKKTMEDKAVRERSKVSELEWEIIKPGSGETPKKGQTVVVHYTGWLSEDGKPGKKFDSSVDRGEPLKLPIGVGRVIKGWDEGVMYMKKGEKRRLYIPTELGYGTRGAEGAIPPNADLIFDVELLEVHD